MSSRAVDYAESSNGNGSTCAAGHLQLPGSLETVSEAELEEVTDSGGPAAPGERGAQPAADNGTPLTTTAGQPQSGGDGNAGRHDQVGLHSLG